jgi:hypothetical protein
MLYGVMVRLDDHRALRTRHVGVTLLVKSTLMDDIEWCGTPIIRYLMQ